MFNPSKTGKIMHEQAAMPPLPVPPEHMALRLKIGALCHFVRAMGVVYLAWILVAILRFWVNEEWVIFGFGARLKTNIGGVSVLQRIEACGVDLINWLFLLGVVVAVWRLFGGFLNGSIFTIDAARRLRSVGTVGIATVIVGFFCQPIKAMIVTSHLPVKPEFANMLVFDPAFLLNFTFCAMLIALAHVFKSASELASDNAGII